MSGADRGRGREHSSTAPARASRPGLSPPAVRVLAFRTTTEMTMSPTGFEMEAAMRRQPAEMSRLLAERAPIERVVDRIRGRRMFIAGTGTSLHAAHQAAFLLRLAGEDATAMSAADSATWGPRPATGQVLVVLSHRGTKRRTSEVLARASADGAVTVSIGGIGSGADIETVPQERSGTFTVSHLAALMRVAQVARALGADLPLESVPDAIAAALSQADPGVELPQRGLEFVGAGPNQWTAAEGALKVREAAHLFTSSYAVEQLVHGPGFALEWYDGLVCLDGGGPEHERLRDVSEAIESRGARVYRFTATDLGEPLSIFPLTVQVQRIALEFAIRLSTDPDNVAPPAWAGIQL
jgi:glutamine---fructose-6-phosphate transaminase (isomerizing)